MRPNTTSVPRLGGMTGTLRCLRCGRPRYENASLCPDCWGERHPGHGVRNRQGVVLQARLSPELFRAVNFAASLVRQGRHPAEAVRIAAGYYKLPTADVHAALSQRAGRSRKRSA